MRIDRSPPSKLIDPLSINLALWRRAVEWVTGFAVVRGVTLTKKQVKVEAKITYDSFTRECKTEEDVKEVVRYFRRMGYIPNVPNRKKRPSNVQHYQKKTGRR